MSASAAPGLGEAKFNLAVERVALGHSVRSFAAFAGVSQQTIVKAENGETISLASARKIAEAFGREIRGTWEIVVDGDHQGNGASR